MLRLLSVLLVLAYGCQADTGVRILFGVTDRAETNWDGSVEARGARVAGLEPWRFDLQDRLLAGNAWQASTHPIRLFGGLAQTRRPVVANGIVVQLGDETSGAVLSVRTTQGNFEIALAAIPFGATVSALGGRVIADRVPPSAAVTSDAEEQDYPAAAVDRSGDIWLAYIEFQHNPDHVRLRRPLQAPPATFDEYQAPTGGEQVLVRKYAGGAWGSPIALTEPGGDLYRPAIAVDRAGRAWVFWSANRNGNFDLWARAIENGRAGRPVRLTAEAGSDAFPAAATDSSGRVWVTWQAWRNGRAAIYAASQQGNGFSRPAPVSSSSANEWNPAIAADAAGRVTVAWDSYRNGNYDVYARTAVNGRWGAETPLAATPRYEAYPSVAYDPQGRLWVAYEEGGERWGKDYGAYDTTGLALYQGRAVRLRAFDANGRAFDTAVDVGSVLPGAPVTDVHQAGRQDASPGWERPDPNRARDRRPNAASGNVAAPRNSLPRLLFDSSGRLWLAFRSAHPVIWNPIGTVWSEYVVSYDGSGWTGPIFLDHGDNLLDNRPALAAPAAGRLVVIGSSDGRRHLERMSGLHPGGLQIANDADPYNNDLYASTVALPPASGALQTRPAEFAAAAGPQPADTAERAAIARLRGFRLTTPDGTLQILRGEFHRHSAISMDGGSDGTLIDQWRYALDTAGMDWIGCCDHDNGGAREYSWWTIQKLTDLFYSPGHFVPMFNYERSVPYPEGHRNVIFVQRGIRVLPRLPKVDAEAPGHAPDTQMLYRYLKAFDGIVASHTSATNMGTDWRDNDPLREPAVEIYQGLRQSYERPGAPRSNSATDSIGGWRPAGFVDHALFDKGYQFSFEASSDHVSTHLSFANILATAPTREAVLAAFKKRHLYAATDDILAEFRAGDHIMGDAFEAAAAPVLTVRLEGTAPFARVYVVKDNQYVYSSEPHTATVSFTWRDSSPTPGKTSYYYVRGEQSDGQIVWVSPMWITYK